MSARFPQHRPRRNRTNATVRTLVAENELHPGHLIQPVFVQDGDGGPRAIASMPGQSRHDLTSLVALAQQAQELGIAGLAVFPKIEDHLKSVDGRQAHNPDDLVPRVVRALKEAAPGLLIITDVALDPYSSLGQDGIVVDGHIDNDATVDALVRQATVQAEAGADVVAPSDMMDGRVGAIRNALDQAGHTQTRILSYSAKYASAFYGPFRDALDSAPKDGADKKTYQMDPANGDEGLHEAEQDLAEGADWIMVKPGLPYLDVLYRVKERFKRPTFAYHVSGEYAMLKAAVQQGWLDERLTVLESLMCFRRAGADGVLTYYAMDAARWLNEV